MSSSPSDFIDRSRLSNCCGAPMMSGGICSDCHEHAEAEEDKPEPDYDAPKPLSALENWRRNDERNVP